MRACRGARRREKCARGQRGAEDRLRAHEPRCGGSRNRGGDQSGPSRRGDLSRPGPLQEIFQREGMTPEKSFSDLGPPRKFFQSYPREETAPEKFFWGRVLPEKSFSNSIGGDGGGDGEPYFTHHGTARQRCRLLRRKERKSYEEIIFHTCRHRNCPQ